MKNTKRMNKSGSVSVLWVATLRDRLWNAIQKSSTIGTPDHYKWQCDLWRKWSLWLAYEVCGL